MGNIIVEQPTILQPSSISQVFLDDAVGSPKIQETSTLEAEDANPFSELARKIVDHIEQDKPYLQPSFSVTDISMHFGVPRHHIDFCFARIMGEKFTEMRKRLRVEYAKILLPEHRHMSLEGVGKNAGFASKSSFFSSFREVTGMTPAEYIKSLEEGA
jgi:AraC-like DNA-binding protein